MDCSDSIIVERYDNNYNKINIIKILPDSIISLCYIENDNEMYKGIISKEREEAIRLLVDDDKIDTSLVLLQDQDRYNILLYLLFLN